MSNSQMEKHEGILIGSTKYCMMQGKCELLLTKG